MMKRHFRAYFLFKNIYKSILKPVHFLFKTLWRKTKQKGIKKSAEPAGKPAHHILPPQKVEHNQDQLGQQESSRLKEAKQ